VGHSNYSSDTIGQMISEIVGGQRRTATVLDEHAVTRTLAEALRANGRRPIERRWSELTRTTVINGDPVEDVTMASLGDDHRAVSPTESPYSAQMSVEAPLVARLGRVVESPDAFLGVDWSSPLTAGTIDDSASTSKVAFPTTSAVIGLADTAVRVSGVVVDVSQWQAELLGRSGRLNDLFDGLAAATWRQVEANLVAALEAAAGAPAADLAAAVTAIADPHRARVISAHAAGLLGIDPHRAQAAGLELVRSDALAGTAVIAPSAVTFLHSELLVLTSFEPERAGFLFSTSVRHSVVVDASGVSAVA
jgi:hypothetical protein